MDSRPLRRPGTGVMEKEERCLKGANGRTGVVRTPHFRTHALDHIRNQSTGHKPVDNAPAPVHLPPVPAIHGPVDSARLSPVPYALPTDRSVSASSLHFIAAGNRSPKALSPVPVNLLDMQTGTPRARPATADPTNRERKSRRARHERLSPVSFSIDDDSVGVSRCAAEQTKSPPRSLGRSTHDLDSSLASVGSTASSAHNKTNNTLLPLGPQYDSAATVEEALRTLEGGHAAKTMNLRGSLDRCKMHDIERLFEHIAVARAIQALNLSCNHFSDPMSWALERLLERNRSCLALRLGNNRMSDKMCAGVISALYKNTLSHVTEMYLGNNQAGSMTADALARALRPGPGGLQNIRILNLSHNRLGDLGGSLVVEALQHNLSLQILDLGSNDLAFKTKNALCRALKSNQALHEVRIERNPGLEDQGLVDILTTLRFSVHSELTMLYTVEPLAMFCIEADTSGRSVKHWDNHTVVRFLRDVREWYGDHSTALFPISSEMWMDIHKNIQRVEKSLLTRTLLAWHRLCFACAVSRARLMLHQREVKMRPHFNLWVNTLTQKYLEPIFLEKCRQLHSKVILHYLTTWRLCHRHTELFGQGTNWTWRINLPDDAIQICQRGMGKAEFSRWYGAWSHYHFLWHALSVKTRSKDRKWLNRIVSVWAAAAREKRRRVQGLHARYCKSLCAVIWKDWQQHTAISRQQHSLMRRAGQRLTAMTVAVAFADWRQRADASIVYNRKIGKIMQILGYGQLGSAMASWKKIIQKKRRAELNIRKSDTSILKHLMKSTVWCAKHWREVKNWKKRQRHKVKIGLLRLVFRSFAGWKLLRGRREDKELRESVIAYKYGMRRCRTLLRNLLRSVSKHKRMRQVLEYLLHDRDLHAKRQAMQFWRQEARGTHLYKKKYCYLLRGKVVVEWLSRIHRAKHIQRITAKLVRPRLYRQLLASCTAWKAAVLEGRVHKQKVGRVMHKVGLREEQEFFIAWIEAARSQIRRSACLRKGILNLAGKYWQWFLYVVDKARRERTAANILFNFGEDRRLTATFSAWHKVILADIRGRVLAAMKQGRVVKAAALDRLRQRLNSKFISQHWQAWSRMTIISRVWLRGYEAYRGLLTQSELAKFCSRSPNVDVPRLLAKLPLGEAEEGGNVCLLFRRVLLHWDKLQNDGDMDYKLELQRFLAFLCGKWTAGEIPLDVSFGSVNIVAGGAGLSVRCDDDGRVCLDIPKVDTAAELRCRMQRAMAIALSPSFGSLLVLPCPLLQAAHEFCREFLCVPRCFLDSRGDHERWTERISKHVGEPSRVSICPQGWARVGIHVDEAVVAEHSIWSKWNVSFHAVRQEMIAQVVHSRMLLRAGDVGALGRTIHSIPGVLGYLGDATHKTKFVVVPQVDGPDSIEEYDSKRSSHQAEAGAEEFQPSKHFLTSPSIVFTSQLGPAVPVNWRGRKAQVVLQTRQRPDVSRILAFHDPTQASTVDVDYANEELRWFTPSYGPAAIAVTGILFRFAD